ncbi:hypothetical protein NC651_037913 [Populus alba x Populus x berolinensis]|nr:hypothetical protein NC651_037913 [Populus alba x Populus x berolinensis]
MAMAGPRCFEKDVNQTCQMIKELKAYEVDPKVKIVILKVAIIDGIVMGGGAGLSLQGTFRIVTENTESEAETRAEKWILEAINWMKSACPTSLKISLRSIREGRTQGLEQCLIQEFTVGSHIARRTVSDDFYEWDPSKLELVTDEIVDRYFSKADEDYMESLQLPTRSTLVDTMRPKL